MDLSALNRSAAMVDVPGMFEDVLSGDNIRMKSSRCVYCKGSKMLCGKSRCSVLARHYSNMRARAQTERLALDGNSPPSVFIGRLGYPKVAVGPMIPPYHGDTSMLDTPERWKGL